jgi:hypothetical protein
LQVCELLDKIWKKMNVGIKLKLTWPFLYLIHSVWIVKKNSK